MSDPLPRIALPVASRERVLSEAELIAIVRLLATMARHEMEAAGVGAGELPPASIFDPPPRNRRMMRSLMKLPAPQWVPPDLAAEHIGISTAALWKGVAAGRITPPAYPTPKNPRFFLLQLDKDMEGARLYPMEHAAGQRAAKLTEARKKAREKRKAAAAPAP